MTAPTRIPPSDLAAEAACLGAAMLTNDAAVTIVDLLDESRFYKPAHAATFRAIARLVAKADPVDPLTVADELARVNDLDGVGGTQALLSMMNTTPVSTNVRTYAGIVKDKAIRRRLISAAAEIMDMAYDAESAEDAAAHAEELVLAADVQTGRTQTVQEGAIAAIENWQESAGLLTGIRQLDREVDPLHPGRMIVVGARPGHGKTAFGLGLAKVASLEFPTAIFSLEMSYDELGSRALVGEAGASMRVLMDVGGSKLVRQGMERLAPMALLIDDTPSLTVAQLAARARRLKAKHGLGLIVVDYLQLITPSSKRAGSREAEVAEISRGLKLLARQLQVPVIVCAQLNRQVENRQEQRPRLSDLRESGAIEQDADVVIGLYNPDHGKESMAEAIVLKNRHGATPTIPLLWQPAMTRFRDAAIGATPAGPPPSEPADHEPF